HTPARPVCEQNNKHCCGIRDVRKVTVEQQRCCSCWPESHNPERGGLIFTTRVQNADFILAVAFGRRSFLRKGPRKVKKFEVIETTCDLELPNSADHVTLRMICSLS